MQISNQQELFLKRFTEVGSLDCVLEEFHIAKFQLSLWLENSEFAKAYQVARRFYIQHLNEEIAVQGLQKLRFVLKNGEETVTTSNSQTKKHLLDNEGNVVPVEDTKRTTTRKINKHPNWAIIAAVRLHLEEQRKNTTLGAIQTLIDEGLIPSHVLDRVSGILERAEGEVQGILAGEIQTHKFSKDDIAEIQRYVIGGG